MSSTPANFSLRKTRCSVIIESGYHKANFLPLQLRCDDGVHLDFDQHLGRHQRRHFYHSRRGANVAKDLAMGAPDLVPLLDVGYVGARADHIMETGACLFQCTPDILEY